MDQILRELYREYISGDLDSKAKLDRHCERLGLLGPSLAEACQVASRLHDAILLRQEVFSDWSRGNQIQLASQLRNMSWDSPISAFDNMSLRSNISYMLQILWNYLEETFENLQEIPSFNKYADLLFPLFLRIINQNKHRLEIHNGVERIGLERWSPEEFAAFGSRDQRQRSNLRELAKVVEAGFTEVYTDRINADEYEGLAKLLPKSTQNKLKDLWDIETYPQFGDFLAEEYGEAFSSAYYTGIEVGTYREMFQTFAEVVDAVTWKSGAVATLTDPQAVDIWIAPEELKEAIKTSKANPFYDLDFLLEDPTIDIYIRDDYYDFDKEAAKERLLEELPKELTED